MDDATAAVRAVYAALNRRDIDGALAVLPHDVDWDFSRRAAEPAGVLRGREGGRPALRALFDAWAELRFDPLELRAHGDRLVVPLRIVARGAQSGIDIEARVTHAWVVHGGQIVRFEYHPDVESAIRG